MKQLIFVTRFNYLPATAWLSEWLIKSLKARKAGAISSGGVSYNWETSTRRTGANFCARCLRAAALNRNGCAAKSTDKLPLRSRGAAVRWFHPPGTFAHLFLAAPTSTINASRIPNLNRNLRPARSYWMSPQNYGRNIMYLNHIISHFLSYTLHICYTVVLYY